MCRMCLTQWERRPLRDHGDGPLLDMDVMGFGKYAHLTYQQVFLSDPDYVDWCILTMRHSQDDRGLIRFAKYCQKKQQSGTSPSAHEYRSSTRTRVPPPSRADPARAEDREGGK